MGVLRRKSPLFRRKSSRNVAAIEAEVDYVVQRSPFLLAAENNTLYQQDDSERDDNVSETFSTAATHTTLATFARKELQVGQLLGTGSFSSVHSVIGYKLSTGKRNKQQQQQQQQSLQLQLSTASSCSDASCLTAAEALQESRIAVSRSAFDAAGNAQYAVKFVKKELSKKPHAFRNAAADLVVEAKYLAALDHKNLIKIHGIARGGTTGFMDGHDGFFMIVDLLQETLADRIQTWKQERQQMPYQALSLSEKKQHQINLLTLQADYALQTADAIAYLHQRRIIWRDVKPSNIGFSSSDPHTVKIFDLGLCRELPECQSCCHVNSNKQQQQQQQLVNADDDTHHAHHDDDAVMFHMSGAGTYLYMAVEILNTKRYNLKADVYSWAFLFHEMIALERPFDHYSFAEHKEFVCEIGQRPSLDNVLVVGGSGDGTEGAVVVDLPPALKSLLRQAWEQDPTQRLTMKQVVDKLKPILQDLKQHQLVEQQVNEVAAVLADTVLLDNATAATAAALVATTTNTTTVVAVSTAEQVAVGV